VVEKEKPPAVVLEVKKIAPLQTFANLEALLAGNDAK